MTRSTLLAIPICRALCVGPAHGIRRTVPPSWSTMMNSGGWPPAAAAACSFEIAAISADFVVMLKPNRTMPPTSPRWTRPSRLALGVVPSMRMTSFCPTRWASVVVAALVVPAATAAPANPWSSRTKASSRLMNRLRNAAGMVPMARSNVRRHPFRRLQPIPVTAHQRHKPTHRKAGEGPNPFARRSTTSYSAAGPQSMCRGRNVIGRGAATLGARLRRSRAAAIPEDPGFRPRRSQTDPARTQALGRLRRQAAACRRETT